ncbi:MAG TPA: DUF4232 domain-containing protein, partial [Acidimicrobiales bacterium]|nr:DUF4232 domain-containing protein [Acidimicrobiales bacterium]
MTNRLWGTLGTGLALAMALSACTSSSNRTATGGSTTTTGGSTATTGAAPTTAGPTTPTSGGSPVTATSPTTAAGPGRCPTSSLTGSLAGASGTAGSTYYQLVLTNTGSTSCVIQGYAGVSFV